MSTSDPDRREGGARLVRSAVEHRITTVRRARYYTVGGGDAPPAEVWIVLHGFGQLAGEFVRYFQHIASAERLIVAPEALNRFYKESGSGGSHAEARVGTTWMTREDRENEIRDYVDFLDAVHARVARAARVTALGFSQGVATAARWVTLGTSRVDRFIAWAGELPPDLDMERFRSRLPNGLVHVEGASDEYATWVKRDESAARLAAAGIAVETVHFDGGHRLDAKVLARLAGA